MKRSPPAYATTGQHAVSVYRIADWPQSGMHFSLDDVAVAFFFSVEEHHFADATDVCSVPGISGDMCDGPGSVYHLCWSP